MKKTNTILDKVLSNKALEVSILKQVKPLSLLKRSLSRRKTNVRDFFNALGKPGKLNIMAEIKKASPSAGLIKPDFDHIKIAKEYQDSGLIDAISVLTEKRYFQGDIKFIRDIKKVTSIPILRKDFIFDEYQIYESYLAEADALLLIVAALEVSELKHLISLTHKLGMNVLVETHSEKEIEIALKAGARIIGINARDLNTFKVDNSLFERLSKYIPREIINVAESGLENKNDVKRVYDAGANAVLIGTAIMKSKNMKAKIENLVSLV